MFTYIALLTVLLLLSYWEASSSERSSGPIKLAALAVILFVGLRFETGSDWVEYELLLKMTEPFFVNIPTYFSPNLVVEPGFGFLLSILSTLDLPFQLFLFVSAIFSIWTLAYFLWSYSQNSVLALLWYCGFALLIGQMAAIRQVVAYGFLFLSFIALDRGKMTTSILWSVIAVSMHVFAAALIPMIYLGRKPPRSSVVVVICTIGLATVLVGINIFGLIVSPLAQISSGIIGTKLGLYNSVGASSVSSTSMLLFVWHAVVLLTINRPGREDWRDPIIRFAVYAAIWGLFAHSFLASTPAIWNRVMLFSMPVELVGLLRCYPLVMRVPLWRAVVPAGVWLIASASIGYALSQENALPYVPYRSLVQVWATGDYGDGRLRYTIEQRRLERRVLEEQQLQP